MTRCYLTVGEAAPILGLSPAAVRLMALRGDLATAAETEGGLRLFNRSDVEKVQRERERKRLKATQA